MKTQEKQQRGEHGETPAEMAQAQAKAQDTVKHSPLPFPKQIARGKHDGELVDENGFYITNSRDEVIRRYNTHERLMAELERIKSERDDYFRQCGDIEKGFNEMMLERDYLARRCDELLLALKDCEITIRESSYHNAPSAEQARAAIAKVEGGKQ